MAHIIAEMANMTISCISLLSAHFNHTILPETLSRNRCQHVIVHHRTLQTDEESGIYVEVSDKTFS